MTGGETVKIYGDLASGNCLKVKYTADYLGIPYEWMAVDIMKDESRTAEFLAINPAGQVPTLVLDDGRALAQSNAILLYLAEDSLLIPSDPYQRARVNELLFWEQYSHEPYIAVCRFHMVYLGRSKESREAWRVERGEQALVLMEKMLDGQDWFVGDRMTVADISLLAYTRLAPEGGFDMTALPRVNAWIARCEETLGLEATTPNRR